MNIRQHLKAIWVDFQRGGLYGATSWTYAVSTGENGWHTELSAFDLFEDGNGVANDVLPLRAAAIQAVPWLPARLAWIA